MKATFIFLLSLIYISASAQVENIAYIYNPAKDKGKQDRITHKALLNKLAERETIKHYCYKLDDDGKIQFIPKYSYDSTERAGRYLLFYDFNIPVDYTPPVKISKTQSGKINGVYFVLPNFYITVIKVIDITTNEVVHVKSNKDKSEAVLHPDHRINIENYQKHFTNDPEKYRKNTRAWNKTVYKLNKKYEAEFKKYYDKRLKEAADEFAKLDGVLNYPDIIAIDEVEMKGKRAKRLKIHHEEDVITNDWGLMRIFTLDTFKNYVFPDLFGFYFADDKEKEKGVFALRKTLFSKSKKVGEAYENGEQLYASFSDAGFSKKLKNDQDQVRLGIDLDINAINTVEKELSRIRMITVVDKQSVDIVDQFRDLYKQERFMDDMVIPKATGIDILLTIHNDNFQFTDTETGRLLHSIEVKEGFDGMYDALLEITGLEIEIIKRTKEKKEKLIKAQIYSPLGFWQYHKFEIFVVHEENINGKIKNRPVLIGEAVCYADEDGQYIAEMKIKDGEKELYAALEEGLTVKIRNKDRGFFIF